MQQISHLRVNGIGDANVLAIAKHHAALGITQHDCVQRILTAPNILKFNLTQASAIQIADSLKKVGLPCSVIDANKPAENEELVVSENKYEIAAYISKHSAIAEFASKVAAFTGQTGEEIIKCLANTPANLLGNLSKTVAHQLAQRFSCDGIEVLVSCPLKAKYTVVAYAMQDAPSVQQYYQQMGMRRYSNEGSSHQWQAQNIDYGQAQKVWAKATEAHLPVVVQNHDYMRFDIQLQALSAQTTSLSALENNTNQNTQHKLLSACLLSKCGIPVEVHSKLMGHLPIIVKRCASLKMVQNILADFHQAGATAEAILVSGVRFNIHFPQWQAEYQPFINKLSQMVMNRAIAIPKQVKSTYTLKLNASLHQVMWMQHECERQQICSKLLRVSE